MIEAEGGEFGVEADPVAVRTQLRQRPLALGRGEVVEDARRHQEVRRLRAVLALDRGDLARRLEREVDVVAEEEIAGLRLVVEEGEAVAAARGRVEQLPVVVEVEAAHVYSTSTSRSRAAASARSSASRFVSPVARTYPRRSPSNRTGLIVSPTVKYTSACTTPGNARTRSSPE